LEEYVKWKRAKISCPVAITIEQSISSGWTMYEALLKAQRDKEIQFKTKTFFVGHYVTFINNVKKFDLFPLHDIYLLPS